MPRTRTCGRVGLWTMFLVVSLAGCNSYPYSPYGPAYGPGMAPPPGNYIPPTGTYSSPGTYSQPQLTPIPPQSSVGGPSAFGDPNPNTNILPPSPEGSPFYNGANQAPPGNNINNPVPNPVDQNNNFDQPTDDLFMENSTSSLNNSQQIVISPQPRPREPSPFVSPGQGVQQANAEIDPFAQKPQHFDYDSSQYRWLKGVTNFENNSWNIIYDMVPDKTDRFQGSLTLQAHPQLKQVRRAVQLEGYLDPNQKDALGKPIFIIQRLTELQ